MPDIRTSWPGGFEANTAVHHKGRNAHVAAAPPWVVETDLVPITYDDESGISAAVPYKELVERTRRSPNDY